MSDDATYCPSILRCTSRPTENRCFRLALLRGDVCLGNHDSAVPAIDEDEIALLVVASVGQSCGSDSLHVLDAVAKLQREQEQSV